MRYIVAVLLLLFVCCGSGTVTIWSEKVENVEKNSGVLTTVEKGFDYSVKILNVEGNKYIVFWTGNGVTMCPAKE
jgi:hypothetical protein